MVDAEGHEQWVRSVWEKTQAMGLSGPHRHVWSRIAVLLQHADVVWADGDLTEEGMRTSGQVIVFTERHVAVATLTNEFRWQDYTEGAPSGSTDVKVISRGDLEQISVLSDAEGDDPRANAPYVWISQDFLDGEPWPRFNAPIKLRYRGGMVVTVNGRLSEKFSTSEGPKFMASLLEDLTT
ncbi:hypothetical protein [Janibacter terrae]|uniref:hypothetical protein n=1 Tax=Janibacter terrae TaxID=103817 RepID=UPI000832E036|nr:hypothetical protein [Janibacter terrae]